MGIKIHSVAYNYIMDIILKISSILFPLITFPYVSRVLLAEGTGKVAFGASIISYFSLLASLGIPAYGVKVCAESRGDRTELSRTVQELLIINMVSVLFSYAAFLVLLFQLPQLSDDKGLLLIQSADILLSAIGVEWFYRAIEQYDYITVRNLFFKILAVVAMFVFVKTKEDYVIYGATTIIGTVGSNFLNLFRLRSFISLRPVGGYRIRRHIKPILMLFFYTAATMVYTNLDTVMLGFISGKAEVGIYNAAVRLKVLLTGVVTALGSVTLSRVSFYLSRKDGQEKADSLIRRSFAFVLFLSFPLTVYILLEAEAIILFLAGSAFFRAAVAMRWIMPTLIFIGLSSVTAWQILIPAGKNGITLCGSLIGAGVDLLLNAALIPRFGAAGAAIGTLAAEACVFFFHAFALRELVGRTLSFREMIKISTGCILALISAFFGRMLASRFNALIPDSVWYLFWEILITGVLFFGTYIISILALKEESAVYIARGLFNRLGISQSPEAMIRKKKEKERNER